MASHVIPATGPARPARISLFFFFFEFSFALLLSTSNGWEEGSKRGGGQKRMVDGFFSNWRTVHFVSRVCVNIVKQAGASFPANSKQADTIVVYSLLKKKNT